MAGNNGTFDGTSSVSGSPAARSVLQSPSRAHITRSPAISPAKLAPNHAIFMANIDSSPTKRKEELCNGNSSSSTKVIENLHEQIDTLTNTNLQLTVQSHSLLDKLETAQQRESKLLENTASLKHENENIASMLNRKSRKLRDVEDDYEKLKKIYDELSCEKSELEKKFQSTSDKEKSLEQQVEMFRVQYDALVDSQDYYKEHYSSEVRKLKEQLGSLKKEQHSQLERHSADMDLLSEKLSEFDVKSDTIQQLEKDRLTHLEGKCDDMVNQLDLNAWVNLYKESARTLLDYAEKMNITLPQQFHQLTQDPDLAALDAETKQSTLSSMIPLKMAKVRSNRAATSPNSNTLSTSTHAKRSSFYGSATQFPTSASGALPGVKRSSSRRTNSGKSDKTNSSADSSPVLRQVARNASSPSPRMGSASSFRRN